MAGEIPPPSGSLPGLGTNPALGLRAGAIPWQLAEWLGAILSTEGIGGFNASTAVPITTGRTKRRWVGLTPTKEPSSHTAHRIIQDTHQPIAATGATLAWLFGPKVVVERMRARIGRRPRECTFHPEPDSARSVRHTNGNLFLGVVCFGWIGRSAQGNSCKLLRTDTPRHGTQFRQSAPVGSTARASRSGVADRVGLPLAAINPRKRASYMRFLPAVRLLVQPVHRQRLPPSLPKAERRLSRPR
jgi:hypothetical protein